MPRASAPARPCSRAGRATLARRTGAQAFIVDARGAVLATTDPDLDEPLDDAQRAIARNRLVQSVAGEGDGEARVAAPVHADGRRLAVLLHKRLGDQRAP